ncbi:MAG: tyrosine-type recombinase/integrase [Hyphomicrobiaceae bacterium]
MPNATFTIRWVEALKPTKAGDEYWWDDRMPGFGLRLGASGSRTFVAQARHRGAGTQRRVTLGRYGVVTLDQARDKARKHLAAAAEGRDIVGEVLAAKKVEDARLTLSALADKWLALHVRPKRAERTAYDYEKVLRLYLRPAMGEKRVDEISRAEVLELHNDMSATPKVADYAIVVAKAAVNFGLKNDLLPKGMPNPFAGVELYGGEGRERFLSASEVERLGDAITALQASGDLSPWSAAALRLLVFTGCRKGEILGLRWAWVSFDQGALLLPTSKTGKRRVELSPPAIEVLKAVPRVEGNEFVIVGQRPGTHMQSLMVPWRRVCAHAGISDCRVHDLRHSFASFAAADGLSLPMIGKLLGHTVPATTARYAHLADEAKKRANDVIGMRLGELMKAGAFQHPVDSIDGGGIDTD